MCSRYRFDHHDHTGRDFAAPRGTALAAGIVDSMAALRPDITLTIRQKLSGEEHRIYILPITKFSLLKRHVAMLYGLTSRDYVLLFLERVNGELPLQEDYGWQSIQDMGIQDGDELGTLAVDAECILAGYDRGYGLRCEICDEEPSLYNDTDELYQCGRCGEQPVCPSCMDLCDVCSLKACRRCIAICRYKEDRCKCRQFFLTKSRQLFLDL